ncbi:hypothetical protein [Marinicrinis sediminis]|uniref:DUF4254 domain-containing protein n=1 Tax=Marinicrinis sediminis TaxID=1652465 RepID=A0ABW5R8K5_9BACL
MVKDFVYNARLGIALPDIEDDWTHVSLDRRQRILLRWEEIRGSIPDRIKDLEGVINCKQERLNDEEQFERSCELNHEIAELASQINDLQIWYRVHQEIKPMKNHV